MYIYQNMKNYLLTLKLLIESRGSFRMGVFMIKQVSVVFRITNLARALSLFLIVLLSSCNDALENTVLPTGIDILADDPIYLTSGTQASIDFSVTPSNASITISEDNCQVALLYKEDTIRIQTGTSNVHNSSILKLLRVDEVYDDVTGKKKEGQYRAFIEDAKKYPEYEESLSLVLSVDDENGNVKHLSTSEFKVVGMSYDSIFNTGLPVVVINTPNSKSIHKSAFVQGALISIINSDLTFDLQDEMKIRGRGNTTWLMPKKPYKIKLSKKQSVLGEAKDKEWVLITNYSDKTQLRNAIALFMGQNSILDYTSSFHFVELILNGSHQGTYMLAEQQKISKNRVNVGENGFLVEVDAREDTDDVSFHTPHMKQPFDIKDPKVEIGDENYNYVSEYFCKAEEALYSLDFTDPLNGYTNYIDVDSFVEWYLINEIARNNDAYMYASCYMHLTRGGKIKMGPLWDFDTSFGNINYNDNWLSEGFYVKYADWIGRMFDDPAFVQKVKTRMAYFFDNKQKWLDQIDLMADYLDKSQSYNEDIWHTMNEEVWPNYVVCGSYSAEVDYLKQWLSDRIDWLHTNISAL